MSATAVGIAGILLLFGLFAIRMPVGLAMMLVGFTGTATLIGFNPALSSLGSESFTTARFYELLVLPLFILMGNLAGASGMSGDLYRLAYVVIGRFRGGLATATIVGCGGFAALSGSSLASAITMGRVALPEMQRYKYSDRLATGAIAAGGTLGILIPPSTGFVIYAILTEQSIGQLFIAGVLPGLLLIGLFILAIVIVTTFQPELGPKGPQSNSAERIQALMSALPIIAVIALTIGGIYGGVFTPVEAAGIGCIMTGLIAAVRKRLNGKIIREVFLSCMRTTATAFLIVIGAHVLTPFLALSHIPESLAGLLLGLDLGVLPMLVIILCGYIVLGMFLEGLAMLVLTVPIIFPMIEAMGLDPIWFGVVMVIVLEMGLISPPVGVNVFMVKSIADDVSLQTIFWGILPFWVAMIVCLIILVAFPDIALFLPNAMMNQ